MTYIKGRRRALFQNAQMDGQVVPISFQNQLRQDTAAQTGILPAGIDKKMLQRQYPVVRFEGDNAGHLAIRHDFSHMFGGKARPEPGPRPFGIKAAQAFQVLPHNKDPQGQQILKIGVPYLGE